MYHAERLPSVTLSVLWLGGRWWWLGEDIHEIWNECDGGKRVVVGRNGVRQSTVIGRGKTPNWFNHQATPSLGIQLQQWLTWCGEVQSQACWRRLGPDHCRFDKQCYKKSAPPPLKKKEFMVKAERFLEQLYTTWIRFQKSWCPQILVQAAFIFICFCYYACAVVNHSFSPFALFRSCLKPMDVLQMLKLCSAGGKCDRL